jgi:chromosomal replication initiator protein
VVLYRTLLGCFFVRYSSLGDILVIHSIWEDFLKIVREELGSRVVETWFKAVLMSRWDADEKVVYLQTPNTFVCNWLEKNYRSIFQIHLGRLLNIADLKVTFINTSQKKSDDDSDDNNKLQLCNNTEKAVQIKKYKPAQMVPYGANSEKTISKLSERYSRINKNYIFDTFVVGPSNSLAYAASRAVAQKPGYLYNPMFIYGGSGLGKTHLLHAIGNAIQEANKNALVLYQTADRFVNEFINAIRFDKIDQFQKKYQLVDVLLVDDIQFISNKESTQEAFFHLFNSLYDARKQIVFSSDTFPQNIGGIAERLRSRLASGMITDIHQPCIEVKTAILKKKAESSGEILTDEVALIRVVAFAHLTKQPITLELAQKVFASVERAVVREPVDFKSVIKAVGKHFPYSLEDLRSKNRNKELAFVRQVAMYIMKKSTDKSFREIGAYLGSRNHATVMHAFSKIESQITQNEHLQKQIDTITKEFCR